MRLVAWNANYNARRRTFEQDLEILSALNPDLLVISETAKPAVERPGEVHWIGDGNLGWAGLGVVARNGFALEPHPANAVAPAFSAAWRVTGPSSFTLISVWPVKRAADTTVVTYHNVLMKVLDLFGREISGGDCVFAGDFNSSTRVSFQKTTHPEFVAAAAALGLTSVYHHQSGETHGEETVGTFRARTGEFHIDYCFVSHSLLRGARLEVLHDEKWRVLSDHYPLMLELAPLTGIRSE